MDKIRKYVMNFKASHEMGFTESDIEQVKKDFPYMNFDRFSNAFNGNTCMLDKDLGIISYHCDVETAIRCGVEDRDLNWQEFD